MSANNPKYIFFWKPDQPYGWCSNWHDSPFTINDTIYQTSEHYMMAKKATLMGDQAMTQRIIDCDHPKNAQALGRKIKNWNENLWIDNRERIMDEALTAKFTSHPDLRKLLIDTNPKILVEASPVDKIWGIGLSPDQAYKTPEPTHWKGLNLLGQSLMRVRQQLLQQ